MQRKSRFLDIKHMWSSVRALRVGFRVQWAVVVLTVSWHRRARDIDPRICARVSWLRVALRLAEPTPRRRICVFSCFSPSSLRSFSGDLPAQRIDQRPKIDSTAVPISKGVKFSSSDKYVKAALN
ncbi:hypothetical protein ACJJTC_002357 [Scirpophaga incertulas]